MRPAIRGPRVGRRGAIVAVLLSAMTIGVLERRHASLPARTGDARTSTGGPPTAPDHRRLRSRSRAVMRRHLLPRARGLYRISGRVVDATTDGSIANAEVVFGERLVTSSDAEGSYVIDVPAGRYHPAVRGAEIVALARAPRGAAVGRAVRPPGEHVAMLPTPALDVSRDLDSVDLEVAASMTVRGRVRDDSGRPVAGATVFATDEEDATLQPVLGSHVAVSAADGSYRLVVAARPHRIDVFHERLTAASRPRVDLRRDGDSNELELDLTMTAGCVVSGRVHGAPAGGVIHRLAGTDNPNQVTKATTFDTGGRFTWATLDESVVALRAQPERGPASKVQQVTCRAGARPEVLFEIPAEAPDLAGTVVTARGVRVPHAFIDFTAIDGSDAGRDRADEAGAWAAWDLTAIDFHVVARVPGEGMASVQVHPPAHDVVLTLSGTGSLEGRTTGITDGAFTLEADCLPHGRTYPYPDPSAERFLVPVVDGHYRVDRLPACNVWLAGRHGPRRTPEHEATIVAGQTTVRDLDLTALVAIGVDATVVDAAGRAMTDALVFLESQPRVRTQTGLDGSFSLRAPPGARLVISGGGAMEAVTVPAADTGGWAPIIRLSTAAPR